MTQPIFVVTTNDQRTNQTDTAGAFTDLAEAKQCAVETDNMFQAVAQVGIPAQVKLFIEEWHGGTFHAHHELRGTEWWVSAAPAFAPTKES